VRKLSPSVRAGALFPQSAHETFMELTRRQYGNMVGRMKRNKLPPPPFTLDAYRRDVLGVMGGKEDGPIECRYCKRIFTLAEIAVDHAKPLSRGGGTGLDNLDYPCAADNDGKGGLEVAEYLDLLRYLDTIHPLARKDILSRLKKANALAASARRAQALAAELGNGRGKKDSKGKSKPDVEFEELGTF
jgi:5-methylcytosine-specific restriction endonuclease McrA